MRHAVRSHRTATRAVGIQKDTHFAKCVNSLVVHDIVEEDATPVSLALSRLERHLRDVHDTAGLITMGVVLILVAVASDGLGAE